MTSAVIFLLHWVILTPRHAAHVGDMTYEITSETWEWKVYRSYCIEHQGHADTVEDAKRATAIAGGRKATPEEWKDRTPEPVND